MPGRRRKGGKEGEEENVRIKCLVKHTIHKAIKERNSLVVDRGRMGCDVF